jgi:hypothetical protein
VCSICQTTVQTLAIQNTRLLLSKPAASCNISKGGIKCNIGIFRASIQGKMLSKGILMFFKQDNITGSIQILYPKYPELLMQAHFGYTRLLKVKI